MPVFVIQYVATERTLYEIDIEADSLEEAIRLVEEYEFDTSEAVEVSSFEWSIDNVRESATAAAQL